MPYLLTALPGPLLQTAGGSQWGQKKKKDLYSWDENKTLRNPFETMEAIRLLPLAVESGIKRQDGLGIAS